MGKRKQRRQIMKINWIDELDDYGDWATTDPQDGGKPIRVWWDDVRYREVRDLVKEVYVRGMKRRDKEILNKIDSIILELYEPSEHEPELCEENGCYQCEAFQKWNDIKKELAIGTNND